MESVFVQNFGNLYIDDVCSSHPRPNSFVTGGGVNICTICLVEYPNKNIQTGLAILYYFFFLLSFIIKEDFFLILNFFYYF